MYNKIILIGNLTRDIDFKYLQGSNTPLSKGAIATSYKYKGSDGSQKEETCFLDFSIFGRVAEVANQYLHKGSKVMLEGRLIFEQWQDQQSGQNRSKHSLRVDTMKMLDSKENSFHPRQHDDKNSKPINNEVAEENKQNTGAVEIPGFRDSTPDDLEDIPF
jgi:single-strand DNA-binding protein